MSTIRIRRFSLLIATITLCACATTSCTSETASASSGKKNSANGTPSASSNVEFSNATLFDLNGVEMVAVCPDVHGLFESFAPVMAVLDKTMGPGALQKKIEKKLGIQHLDKFEPGDGCAVAQRKNGKSFGIIECAGPLRESVANALQLDGNATLNSGDLLIFAQDASDLIRGEALAPKIRASLFDGRSELMFLEFKPESGGQLEQQFAEGFAANAPGGSDEVTRALMQNAQEIEGGRFSFHVSPNGITMKAMVMANPGSTTANFFAANANRPNLKGAQFLSSDATIAFGFNFVSENFFEMASKMSGAAPMPADQFNAISRGVAAIFGPACGELSQGTTPQPEFNAFFDADNRTALLQRMQSVQTAIATFFAMQFGQNQVPPVEIRENTQEMAGKPVHEVGDSNQPMRFIEMTPNVFAFSPMGSTTIASRSPRANANFASAERFGNGGVFYLDLDVAALAAQSGSMPLPGGPQMQMVAGMASSLVGIDPVVMAAHTNETSGQFQMELPWGLFEAIARQAKKN